MLLIDRIVSNTIIHTKLKTEKKENLFQNFQTHSKRNHIKTLTNAMYVCFHSYQWKITSASERKKKEMDSAKFRFLKVIRAKMKTDIFL